MSAVVAARADNHVRPTAGRTFDEPLECATRVLSVDAVPAAG